MPVIPLIELSARLAAGKRLLGLDLGTKTIGLAIADESRTIASPLLTIARSRLDRDLQQLLAIAGERSVGGFVVGLPVGMDGKEGRRCQAVRQFARDLLRRMDAPLAYWDERLSTAAVERVLIGEADLSRRRRSQVVDKAAACFILQGALDHLAFAASRRQPPDVPD